MQTTAAPLVIAEAGVNHNGDFDRAIALVRAAKRAGADIVKFQYFTAANIVASGTDTAAYQRANTGTTSQSELLAALELSLEQFSGIAKACKGEGIGFLCTAFDVDALETLAGFGMTCVKVPSGELTNIPMLQRCGRIGLPVLLSTGMGTMGEVAVAVATLERAGAADITILQCTSLYPAPPEAINLRAMVSMAERFRRPVGLSDHSLDDHASIAAVALGACVIEKHLTLDRTLPGPDHQASLDCEAFAAMVRRLRDTRAMLGDGVKRPSAGEAETAALVRRSWHAARDLARGAVVKAGDLVLKRPAAGLAPHVDLTGRRLAVSVAADRPITAGDLEPDSQTSKAV